MFICIYIYNGNSNHNILCNISSQRRYHSLRNWEYMILSLRYTVHIAFYTEHKHVAWHVCNYLQNISPHISTHCSMLHYLILYITRYMLHGITYYITHHILQDITYYSTHCITHYLTHHIAYFKLHIPFVFTSNSIPLQTHA